MNKQDAIAKLHDLLKPGDTVYTILRHVSRSGMSRRISLVTADHVDLDYFIDKAGFVRQSSSAPGLVATNCGMDMGFSLVYNLGARMWPNGTPEPHGTRNGEPDSDGGYALKQRWL